MCALELSKNYDIVINRSGEIQVPTQTTHSTTRQMNTIDKVHMLEWWIRQQEHKRSDLYVLRLDQFGNVLGKQLRNPLVNPMHGRGDWQLLNKGATGSTDWGYLWFGFQETTALENMWKYRAVTLFTSRLNIRKRIMRNHFLYVAVGSSGFFGSFSTPIWTSWRNE